ncbi:MAG: Asp-tRNA(Asn)/Glu-tRNA(Gln) amidotransferase subunit GatA [Candidatus Hydrogenedentes bacterium]|nr:Asp-tRNA(Asn)/Glu-tRNA(Gln) amidotransferase subunit GatA [Candidatus Hydrogenedentota bacterium]
MSTEWYRKTGHEISAAIQRGEVSAQEVTRSFLERIDAVEEQVRAYVEVWYDAALERAGQIDTRLRSGEKVGPLAGVPLGLKDVLCTREGHTTCCSRILQGYRSPFDATCVERLEQAGAVFLGKLNMDEFAMGSSTENSAIQQTRNPWNLECVPGGSSGGSAAAVAADECTWSLGSDTGGSIRQPASLCGCIGMKPTYGRVSRWGLVAFASSLDQVGPFTKDVHDLAIALNTICGHDRRDSTSARVEVPDFTQYLRPEVKGLRIGMPKEFFAEGLGAETRDLVETALRAYESAGAEIVEVSMPHSQYAIAVYYIICTAEASANLARYDGVRYGYRHPDVKDMRDMYIQSRTHGFGPEVQRRIMLGTYVLSSGYYDAYYLKAQKARTLIKRDFEQAFEKCDVIATPTAPTPAFKLGEKTADPLEMYLSDIYTISLNLYGGPGLSIPCGLSSSGLPVGLQLLGRVFDEASLIHAASAYEQLRGFTLGHAPVA